MDKKMLEHLFDVLRRLRTGQEIKFQITRVNTQIQVANGPISSSLIDEGITPEMVNWIINIVGPVILSIASGDAVAIDSSLTTATKQIEEQVGLSIPKEWLRSELEPMVTENLRLAHLHRSASFGNLFIGLGANKLYREHRLTHKKYPFVQFRFDYVDNNAPQPIQQSFMMDMYESELTMLRDALNHILDDLNKDEE